MGFFFKPPIGGNGGGSTGGTVANYSKNISASEWTLIDSGDYSGLYKATVIHNLNSRELIVAIYENGVSSMVDIVNIIDTKTIDIYNDETIDCKIVINSGGVSLDGDDIFVEGGTKKLDSKLTEIDSKTTELSEQLDNIMRDKYVTPEDFGAIGDGVTDDTNAVLNALDYENVYIKNKYYVTKNKIINKKINIFGGGGFVVESQDNTFEFLKFINVVDCTVKDITIETKRNKIELPPANHTRVSQLGSNIRAIWLQGTENITIDNVKFINCEFDVTGMLDTNENIKIVNCDSKNSSQPFYFSNLTNSLISNCAFETAKEMGDGDHFIYFQHETVNNVLIENCTFIAPDEHFGNAIRLSNTPTVVHDITINNCKFKCKTFFNSSSITNKFINCEFEQMYEESNKAINGCSATLENCVVKGNNVAVLIMLYNSDDNIIMNNCKITDGQIQMQSGSLSITNSTITSSIYTSTANSKFIKFMNNDFTANSSGYLIRCGDNLKSVIMNNYLKCNYVFTNYLTGNIAVNNIYTNNIPSEVEGGQNIKIEIM